MRKAEEIKKALAAPVPVHYRVGDPEPRLTPLTMCDLEELQADALALIQQIQAENAEKDNSMQQLERSLSFARNLADGLKAATVKQEQELYVSVERNRQLEAQNAELLEKVEQLQTERDAAVNDLKCNWKCASCKNFTKPVSKCPHFHECGLAYIHWEWRGVQKEVDHNAE